MCQKLPRPGVKAQLAPLPPPWSCPGARGPPSSCLLRCCQLMPTPGGGEVPWGRRGAEGEQAASMGLECVAASGRDRRQGSMSAKARWQLYAQAVPRAHVAQGEHGGAGSDSGGRVLQVCGLGLCLERRAQPVPFVLNSVPCGQIPMRDPFTLGHGEQCWSQHGHSAAHQASVVTEGVSSTIHEGRHQRV